MGSSINCYTSYCLSKEQPMLKIQMTQNENKNRKPLLYSVITQPAYIGAEGVPVQRPRMSSKHPIWPSRGRLHMTSWERPNLTSWRCPNLISQGFPEPTCQGRPSKTFRGRLNNVMARLFYVAKFLFFF